MHFASLKRKRTLDDAEKQQFFDKMRLWKKVAEKKLTFAELVLQDALAKTLKPERFRD